MDVEKAASISFNESVCLYMFASILFMVNGTIYALLESNFIQHSMIHSVNHIAYIDPGLPAILTLIYLIWRPCVLPRLGLLRFSYSDGPELSP